MPASEQAAAGEVLYSIKEAMQAAVGHHYRVTLTPSSLYSCSSTERGVSMASIAHGAVNVATFSARLSFDLMTEKKDSTAVGTHAAVRTCGGAGTAEDKASVLVDVISPATNIQQREDQSSGSASTGVLPWILHCSWQDVDDRLAHVCIKSIQS
jgi:hypothetical protein